MNASSLIARCRARAGLSQRELAERSGTSAAAICRHEQGQRVPRVDTLARIVAATGATLELRVTWPDAPVDLAANGRALEQVLELADHLPHRPEPHLTFPVLRDLAAGSRSGRPEPSRTFRELASP